MVSSHFKCLLLPQWFVFPTRRKTKGSLIYFWKCSKKSVHLIKHIVIWRYDVKKVLDDAQYTFNGSVGKVIQGHDILIGMVARIENTLFHTRA